MESYSPLHCPLDFLSIPRKRSFILTSLYLCVRVCLCLLVTRHQVSIFINLCQKLLCWWMLDKFGIWTKVHVLQWWANTMLTLLGFVKMSTFLRDFIICNYGIISVLPHVWVISLFVTSCRTDVSYWIIPINKLNLFQQLSLYLLITWD